MSQKNPKRLADVPITSFGRPFDHPQSRCLTSEQLAVAPAFLLCQGSLADNLGYFSESGLIVNDVVFDVVDDARFNAFATTSEGYDIIIINSGVPICLAALYYKLLSYRTIFPWVGHPERERQQVNPLSALPDSFQNDDSLILDMIVSDADKATFLRAVFEEEGLEGLADYQPWRLNRTVRCSVDVVELVPQDRERKLFCNILLRWSLQFILFHEIAHILHGHVDYCRETGAPLYQEIGRALEFAVSQSQEYQADTLATIASFLPISKDSATLYPDVFGSDLTKVVYTWAVVLIIVFTVLSVSEGASFVSGLRTHPHPYHRLAKAFMGAMLKAHQAGLDSRPEHFGVAMDAWKDVDAHLQVLLPGQYGRFFKEDQVAEVNIPLDEAKGIYKHAEQWERFDRLRAMAVNKTGPFQFYYRP